MNLARILQRFWVLTATWELLSGFITCPTRMSLGRYLKVKQWHIVAACYSNRMNVETHHVHSYDGKEIKRDEWVKYAVRVGAIKTYIRAEFFVKN
jgi:hypothetical protein